jgi:polysaccharide export outer membrane protein
MIRQKRQVAKAWGLGLAVYLLASLATGWAQQDNPNPGAQQVVAPKESSTPTATPEQPKTRTSDYTVSPEDLLDVQVMDVPEVSRTYRVSSNGFLTLPLLPQPIPAAGVTLDELSRVIATKFHDAGMLSNAQVTVSLKETRYHTVLVSGEVMKPASYPIFGPTHLIDILVEAGGLAPDAGNNAVIMRGDIGQREDEENSTGTDGINPSANGQSFSLDIRKLIATGVDRNNILLYPGDRVTVQRAALIYLLGAVTRPGGYVLNESRQQITAIKALAEAGDVTNVAKKEKIVILRRDPSSPSEERVEIPVNYKAIVKGKMADIRMKPDDILFVPESAKTKAWHAAAAAATSVVTNGGAALLIYH